MESKIIIAELFTNFEKKIIERKFFLLFAFTLAYIRPY